LLAFLVNDPKLLRRVLDEQESILSGNKCDYEHLQHMELLHRCIKETIRCRLAPLGWRRVKQDLQYKSFVIPKGHYLCQSTLWQHYNPQIYPNPYTFDPDRFAPGREEDKKGNYLFCGFGYGRHKCIGESLAYMSIKQIMSYLLKHFTFELINGMPEANWSGLLGMIKPTSKCLMKYTSKQQIPLYQ